MRRQLKAIAMRGAIAATTGVLVVWAGSNFFGVGEIADSALLIVRYVARGGVATEIDRCLRSHRHYAL